MNLKKEFGSIIDSCKYKTLNKQYPSLDSEKVYELLLVLKDKILELEEKIILMEKK